MSYGMDYTQIASEMYPGLSAHELMIKANEIFDASDYTGKKPYDKPHQDVDVNYAGFLSLLDNQRERDIAYLTNNFHAAYKVLHVQMRLGEMPNPYYENLTRHSYGALTRMSAENLLTKGLPKKILKWLTK